MKVNIIKGETGGNDFCAHKFAFWPILELSNIFVNFILFHLQKNPS